MFDSVFRMGLSVGEAAVRPAARLAGRTAVRGTRYAVNAALDSGMVDDALGSPAFDRLSQRVLDNPNMERLVFRVIDSSLVDAAVARLLESDDLWLVVDEVARSPAVTDAISHQGIGFAEQVAGTVRQRSVRADDRIERAARRLLRRPEPPAP